MPPKPRKPAKVPVTARIDADVAARLRAFVHDYCGKPLHVSLGGLVQQAVSREMDRLELVLSGALPLERASGTDAGEEPPEPPAPRQRRPINASRT